jgi:predicted transposase YbfD/YdcC
MGCQKESASQVRAQGADYMLAVKDNQKNLAQAIQVQLGRGHSKVARAKHQTREKDHGREDRLTYTAVAAPSPVTRHWPDAQSIARVRRETIDGYGKKTKEVRYFLCSLPSQVERLAALIRGHWGIENRLHWSLDVTFNEDQSRIRQGHAAENSRLLLRLALSILKRTLGIRTACGANAFVQPGKQAPRALLGHFRWILDAIALHRA